VKAGFQSRPQGRNVTPRGELCQGAGVKILSSPLRSSNEKSVFNLRVNTGVTRGTNFNVSETFCQPKFIIKNSNLFLIMNTKSRSQILLNTLASRPPNLKPMYKGQAPPYSCPISPEAGS
jgi:hypothetical protein